MNTGYTKIENSFTATVSVCAFGQRTEFDTEIHYEGEYDAPSPDYPGAGIIISGAWLVLSPALLSSLGNALNDEDCWLEIDSGWGPTGDYFPRFETLKINEGLLEFNDTSCLEAAIAEHAELYA